jgi:hypothetical protein
MRPHIHSDPRISPRQREENNNSADGAVATIWLVFYALALGVAIASPIVSAAIETASR